MNWRMHEWSNEQSIERMTQWYLISSEMSLHNGSWGKISGVSSLSTCTPIVPWLLVSLVYWTQTSFPQWTMSVDCDWCLRHYDNRTIEVIRLDETHENEWVKEWINQFVNQSVNEPVNQSVNQCFSLYQQNDKECSVEINEWKNEQMK